MAMDLQKWIQLNAPIQEKTARLLSKERLLLYTGGQILVGDGGLSGFEDTTPALPEAHAYKMTWLAFRTEEPRLVVEVLNPGNNPVLTTNWPKGVAGARTGFCFVAPAAEGWVLALNPNIPDVATEKGRSQLAAWSLQFGEVQYFSCDSSTASGAFCRFVAGKTVRGCSLNDGVIALNEGGLTEIEQQIIAEARQKHQTDQAYLTYMEETGGIGILHNSDYVARIAASWGLDPLWTGCTRTFGCGYLFRDFDADMIRELVEEKMRLLKMTEEGTTGI